MRIAVLGATGNVGVSLLRLLATDERVESILGVARRRPELSLAKTEWREADIAGDDLVPLFRGADAVVHLAWAIQPSHDPNALRRTNVDGSARVLAAVAEAGVGILVYASSVGAYSPGPKDRRVDESWPVGGLPTSFYARHKAAVEQELDAFERQHPAVRVVRLRPALVFQREAASEIRRLFAGPLLPTSLLRRGLVPVVPDLPGLRFQAVHAADVAQAYRLALLSDVRGPFNLAADPVLDAPRLAATFGARIVRVPRSLARGAMALLWRLHLQPTPPGWLDLGLSVPLMDTTRARLELGWVPTVAADDALRELVDGMREGAGVETPPLAPSTSGPARTGELATGVGSRR